MVLGLQLYICGTKSVTEKRYFLELPSPTETGSVHLEVSKEEREIEHLTEVRDVY